MQKSMVSYCNSVPQVYKIYLFTAKHQLTLYSISFSYQKQQKHIQARKSVRCKNKIMISYSAGLQNLQIYGETDCIQFFLHSKSSCAEHGFESLPVQTTTNIVFNFFFIKVVALSTVSNPCHSKQQRRWYSISSSYQKQLR